MKSSVYISSEKIEVVGYTKSGKHVSIKEYVTYPLYEEAMINGKITDSAYLVECLEEMRKKNPQLFEKPDLIVDGNAIFSKRIVVRKLNKRQYINLIKSEFVETAENSDDLVCGYYFSNENGKEKALMACATDKSLVESYITTFQEAGIKLSAIRVGVQAIENYIGYSTELEDKTFILNMFDGVTMLSMIFDNGINVFMSRTRLYIENREQLIESVRENLFGLIQFGRSQKFNEITHSYYLGFTKKYLDITRELNINSEILIDMFDIFSDVEGGEKLSSESHLVYLNALLDKGSIDLINNYKAIKKNRKQQSSKKLWIISITGIVLAMAIPFFYLLISTLDLKKDINEINDYLNSEYVVAKSKELDEISEKTSYYMNISNQLQAKTDEENTMPVISADIVDLITVRFSSIVSIERFDFNETTGIISITGSGFDETSAATYAEALKNSEPVKAVYYVGYSSDGDGTYKFSFEVELEVKE